jgi:hypothetical protein
MKKKLKFFKVFFKDFFKNISSKAITKVITKQADVACVSNLHPHYICNALARYIEIVGMDNIVQICTYNISNM